MRFLVERLAAFVESEPALTAAGELARSFGCRIHLVGGAVRDLILGRETVDLDFILEGPAAPFLRALGKEHGHRVVTFRKRGIVDHRIRTARREWDFVERGRRSLVQEIMRRDFSLNAIAYDVVARRVRDPGHGLRDIRARRLRALSNGIFRDDPLRMLRAVRLQAEIDDLRIERRTAAMIAKEAARIRRVSPERVKAEIDRILASAEPSLAFERFETLGLLQHVLPELDPLRGLVQNRYHHLDAFDHTLAALRAADDGARALARGLPRIVFASDPLPGVRPVTTAAARGRPALDLLPLGGQEPQGTASRSPIRSSTSLVRPVRRADRLPPERARLLRWALLLHDTGKAETRSRGENGEIHFYLHERASARISRAVLRRLRTSRAETAAIERLVSLHLRLSIPSEGEMTPRALRRIVKEAGTLTPLLVLHSLADKIASRGPSHARVLASLRRAGRALLETWRLEAERARRAPPLLDGHDIMDALGIAPGPEIGRLLSEIEELSLSGEIATREEALSWLARLGATS